MFLKEKYTYFRAFARKPRWEPSKNDAFTFKNKATELCCSLNSRRVRRAALCPESFSRLRHQVSAKLYNTETPRGNAESRRTLTAARVLCQIEFQDLRDREERWMLAGMYTACPPAISNFGSVELTKCSARRSRN